MRSTCLLFIVLTAWAAAQSVMPALVAGDYEVFGRQPTWFVQSTAPTLTENLRQELGKDRLSDDSSPRLDSGTKVRVLSATEFEDARMTYSAAWIQVQDGPQQSQRGWIVVSTSQRASGGQSASAYGGTHLRAVDAAGKAIQAPPEKIRATSPLHTAVVAGDIFAVRAALRPEFLDSRNASGATPLQLACENGNLEAATLMLEAGSPLEARDNQGRTALYLASARGRFNLVRILLAAKADTEAVALDGYTPLHVASRLGVVESVDFLLAGGAKVNARDAQGRTALTLARGSKTGNWRQVERSLLAGGGQE